jgi:Ser/Thr protein kinase RdoA (MazF antagonist)
VVEDGGLAAACRAFALDGLRRRRTSGGGNNEHWFVGDALVLRRYNAFRRDDQVAYEHAILGHLARLDWPVAPPLSAPDGRTFVVAEGRQYALFPRLPGRRRPAQPPRDPHALGKLLGRLHAALSESSVPRPPSQVSPPTLGIVVDPLWRQIDVVPDRTLRARFLDHRRELADALGAVDFSTAVAGVVHGDWSEAQLLYRQGVLSAILDFEFAHADLLITDLAAGTTSADIGASVQFVRGYETERDLSDTEVALIGLAQQARHLQHVWPAVHGLAHGRGAGAEQQMRLELSELERTKARWPALAAALVRRHVPDA